jgi:predicted DNA-binding transcriptional regulator AlpA
MKPLTLAEAAQFLRMSRSSLYQRKDIPRYRRPGSRVMLFDQDELEAWLKQGRIADDGALVATGNVCSDQSIGSDVVDMSSKPVYHRHARYR